MSSYDYSFLLENETNINSEKKKNIYIYIYIYVLCFILFYDFSVFQFIVILYERNHWQKMTIKKK